MHVSIAGAALVVSFLLVSVLVSVKEIELRLASSGGGGGGGRGGGRERR